MDVKSDQIDLAREILPVCEHGKKCVQFHAWVQHIANNTCVYLSNCPIFSGPITSEMQTQYQIHSSKFSHTMTPFPVATRPVQQAKSPERLSLPPIRGRSASAEGRRPPHQTECRYVRRLQQDIDGKSWGGLICLKTIETPGRTFCDDCYAEVKSRSNHGRFGPQ